MSALLDLLVAPLTHAFVARALGAVSMVAVVCAVVGTFAVLRGMSYLGTALSHSIVPGVAVGYVVSGAARDRLFWWATGTAILTALGMAALTRRTRVSEDAAVGVVYAGMFALGVVIISTAGSFAVDLVHFLFGSILGVTVADLLRIGVVSALIILVVVVFYRELLVVTFDRVFAVSLRLRTAFFTYLLYVLMALAVVAALQTVGIALVLTLMVAPAAAAIQVTRRLHHAMVVAAAIGLLAGIGGLYVSYYGAVASGAAIALVCVGIFVIVSSLARFVRARGVRMRQKERSWNAIPDSDRPSAQS